MIAIDTNVLVRFLVADDQIQSPVVERLFAENRIIIPHTVLLETEWVLRYTYRFARDRVVSALRHVLGMETVVCAHTDAVAIAIGALANGCDFADALHAMTAQPDAEAFVTFDEEFARRAATLDELPPVRLLTSNDRVGSFSELP